MLAPGEMESIISEGKEMTVELVQPRLNIVRLYLGGRRVGYQHPDEVGVTSLVSLPPGRLRLGPPRLGVLSMVSTSSFAVQVILHLFIDEIPQNCHYLVVPPTQFINLSVEGNQECNKKCRTVVTEVLFFVGNLMSLYIAHPYI